MKILLHFHKNKMCNQSCMFVPEKRLMGVTFCVGILGFGVGGIGMLTNIGMVGTIYGTICMFLAILQLFFCFCRISPGVETEYIPMDSESNLYCCGELGCRCCHCNTSWMSVGSLLATFICMAGGGVAFSSQQS